MSLPYFSRRTLSLTYFARILPLLACHCQLEASTSDVSKMRSWFHLVLVLFYFIPFKMVTYCCVIGCKSNSANDKDLSFYCFPKVKERFCGEYNALLKKRRESWYCALKLENGSPEFNDSRRVCSRHFVSSKWSFKIAYDSSLMVNRSSIKLKF